MSTLTRGRLQERFAKLLEGLDEAEAKGVVEELLDDYCLTTFGTTVVRELKAFSNDGKGKVSVLQIHKDKALIISSFGFELTGSITHQGRTKLILEERKESECMKRFDLSA